MEKLEVKWGKNWSAKMDWSHRRVRNSLFMSLRSAAELVKLFKSPKTMKPYVLRYYGCICSGTKLNLWLNLSWLQYLPDKYFLFLKRRIKQIVCRFICWRTWTQIVWLKGKQAATKGSGYNTNWQKVKTLSWGAGNGIMVNVKINIWISTKNKRKIANGVP